MQIQNNISYSSPSFNGLFADKQTYKLMLETAKDVRYNKRFQNAIQDIVTLSKKHDIQIDQVNKGAAVSRILPDGKKELLAVDPQDLPWVLVKAVKKLIEE